MDGLSAPTAQLRALPRACNVPRIWTVALPTIFRNVSSGLFGVRGFPSAERFPSLLPIPLSSPNSSLFSQCTL